MSSDDVQKAEQEHINTMVALQQLLRNGFIAVPYGDNRTQPEELGFVRLRWDIQDLIRVYGADQASAVWLPDLAHAPRPTHLPAPTEMTRLSTMETRGGNDQC